jgi:myxalamid-type polyketide synthase MxaB
MSAAEVKVCEGLVWQFAGQGTLRSGVLKDMYDSESVFRAALASCDIVLKAHLGVGATQLLYFGDSEDQISPLEAERMLSETRYSQAVLVALEYSLSQVWLSRGVSPSAVMGHSLGEYAACVVAGVISLEDCLRLVCERGRLMQENSACEGCMVAVRASATDVLAGIEEVGASEEVSLAAVNGVRSVVVSGSEDGVEKVLNSSKLRDSGRRALKVSRAFHSPLMVNISESFAEVLQTIQFNRPSIRFISTVTGGYVDEELTTTSYWLRHMIQPVLYQSAVELAIIKECPRGTSKSMIVEMGADNTLTRLSDTISKQLKVNSRGVSHTPCHSAAELLNVIQ